MHLANHALEDAAVSRAVELLNRYRPRPGEPDPRGFEWHYLNRRCHADLLLTIKLPGYLTDNLTVSPDGKRLVSCVLGGPNSSSDVKTVKDKKVVKDKTVKSPGFQVKAWDTQTGQELFAIKGYGYLVVSPHGKRLASSSIDKKTVKVWDAQTGQEICTLQGYKYSGTWPRSSKPSLAFSPDGKRLAVGTNDLDEKGKPLPNEVKVWDATTGRELFTVIKKGSTGGSWVVAFSPDGTRLATAGGEVKLWDATTGQPLKEIEKGSTGGGWVVAFSPDGKRLATGSGGEIKLWVAFSPDGKRLATGSGGEIKLWDAKTGRPLLPPIKGHVGSVRNVAFSPDGTRLFRLAFLAPGKAQGSRPVEGKVWDVQTGREVLMFGADDPGPGVRSAVFSPDGTRVVAVVGQRKMAQVKVWDAQTGKELFTLHGHTAAVNCLAFSPDSQRLASGSEDLTLRIWDLQTGRQIRTLKGPTIVYGFHDLVYSPDGKRLATTSILEDTVNIWDAQEDRQTLTLKGLTSPPQSVALSADFSRLSVAAMKFTVKVWDTHTRKETRSLTASAEGIEILFRVALSPNGKRLASVSSVADPSKPRPYPSMVKVWDVESGKKLFSLPVQVLKPMGGPVLAFSADGKRLAFAHRLERKVWDAQTGQELVTFKGGGGEIFNMTFSQDGKRLAGAGGGGVTVWDAETGKEVRTFRGHTSWVWSVAFSPDGKRLASTGDDGTVMVWDAHAQTDVPLQSFKGHANLVYCVAFSPDGKRLATGSKDVRLWDAQTGQLLLTLKGHADSVQHVAFSPDGHRLASVDESGTVKFWDATPLSEKK
jgi:WD40 repeat protein